jgi:hypothetical protein
LIFGDRIERSESSAVPGHMTLMMKCDLGAPIPRFHKFEVLEQRRSGQCDGARRYARTRHPAAISGGRSWRICQGEPGTRA